MKKIPTFLLLLSLQLFGISVVNCKAETIVIRSIEWLTVASPIIAVGKVLNVERVKGQYSVVYENYLFGITENIKGAKHTKVIKFTIRTFGALPVFGNEINFSDEVIVFLSPYKENEDFLKGKFVPTSDSSPLSVINLNKLNAQYKNQNYEAIDMNFNFLTNKNDVIKTCQEAQKELQKYLKTHSLADVKGYYTNHPKDSKLPRFIYPDYLQVPNFMFPDSKETILNFIKN